MRVVIPALLILAIAVLFITVALRDMAQEVDHTDQLATERAAQAAIRAFLGRLRDTHGDYAVWDDAVQNLYEPFDNAFARTNYGDSTRTAVLFDHAYLADADGRTIFAYVRGRSSAVGAVAEFGPPLKAMLAKLAGDAAPYDARAQLMAGSDGDIYAVAAGSVLPNSAAVPMPTGRPRLLVIAKELDDTTIERLAGDYVIDGLRLVKGSVTTDARLPLVDEVGREIGSLTWTERSPGGAAYQRVAPTAYLMMLLVAATIFGLLGFAFHSLTVVRRREHEALHAAYHDSLSGLPNRTALIRYLDEALDAGRSAGTPVAVIFLDLDGFKEVNDTYGHETGDRLIEQVAAGFLALAGRYGMLARVGGDEFALVLNRVETVRLAEDIGNGFIRFLSTPLTVGGRVVAVGTSVGIAAAERGDASSDELLRRADVAMYLAKDRGRNRIARYDSSLDAAKHERLQIAADLRQAVGAGDLTLVYQPIYDARTLEVRGAEALLRWERPGLGPIGSDIFIPIAEESGLIDEIGDWVLRRACADARAWNGLTLAVNVSPAQFRNPGFDQALADILLATGMPPQRLELEMTETHLVAHPERAQRIIAAIRAIGVTVALDDFGTGYSSIGYLRRFSFDKLKLDRSLVHGIDRDRGARQLAEATIALAKALDLDVTAEGVESREEAAILRDAGCEQLQGYGLARPMSAQDFALLIARNETAFAPRRETKAAS